MNDYDYMIDEILSQPITKDCFELTDYTSNLSLIDDELLGVRVSCFIDDLEQLRLKAIEEKNNGNEELSKKYWKELIRWLPEGWLQKRTITMNYENIYSIIRQRKGHKLTEWKEFIDWAVKLPNVKILFDIKEEKPEGPCACYKVEETEYDALEGMHEMSTKVGMCYGLDIPDICKCNGNIKNCDFFAYDEYGKVIR